jgi:GT2 family glycosyltransferase
VSRAVVCAIVRGSGEALAAVRRQTEQAQRVVATSAPSWHAALAAADGTEPWLWLVDGDVVPEPGALAALRDVLDAPGDLPAPCLLAATVLGPDGELDPSAAPWPPLHDRTIAIAAAARGLAAIRLARWGALLVARDALARHGLPRAGFAGGADDLDWTARLLREDPGYLVPGSRATRPAPARRRAREWADRARMLRSPAWLPLEAPWFAYASALEGAGRLRRPSRSPRHSVRRAAGLARFTRR